MVLPAYVGAFGSAPRQLALITGASSGIGLDLAKLMAPNFDLIITARKQDDLESIARELQSAHGNHVHVIPADLAKADAPQQLFADDLLVHRELWELHARSSSCSGIQPSIRVKLKDVALYGQRSCFEERNRCRFRGTKILTLR